MVENAFRAKHVAREPSFGFPRGVKIPISDAVSEKRGLSHVESATPKKLHTYASGSNAERTPTSIQVRDSDRNGLDDILLSFKKDAAENTNEIYRAVIYAYTNFGATEAEADAQGR